MEITVPILTMDTYTKSGHIYPKEMMQEVIDKFNSSSEPLFCEMNPDFWYDYIVPLEQVSHEVTDMWLDRDKVMATIKVLNTPKGQIVKDLLAIKDHDFVFRPFGTGCVVCDGIIEDFRMVGVAMMPADQAD